MTKQTLSATALRRSVTSARLRDQWAEDAWVSALYAYFAGHPLPVILKHFIDSVNNLRSAYAIRHAVRALTEDAYRSENDVHPLDATPATKADERAYQKMEEECKTRREVFAAWQRERKS